MKKITQPANGFTAIELLVTIVVAAAFVFVFYQLFTTVGTSVTASRQRSLASDLAYSYLRKYAVGSKPTWFTCDTSTNKLTNTNDLSTNPNAAGQTIATGTTTEVTNLPDPVVYTVKGVAPFGCSGAKAGTPIRLEVTVTYGSSAQTIRHATLVGY